METIQVRFLADFLNEMLATERTLCALYRAAASRAEEPELVRRLQEFQADSRVHGEILEDLIGDLGGEAGRPSSGARRVLESMVSQMADPGDVELRPWRDLEALLGLELISQRNWQILEAIGHSNGDPPILKAVRKAIHEEDKHVERLREAVLARAPLAVLAG